MLRNFLTEDDLKAYAPNLDGLLWTDDSDYSSQIATADLEVRNDFFSMGLRPVYLRPDLEFYDGTTSLTATETTDSAEDELSRNRWVVNCTALSGGNKTLTLQGSHNDTDWVTVTTATITATGLTSYLITKAFNYYRVNVAVSSGAITIESYMTETVFDTLFAYKTLELIFQSFVKSEGDQWSIKRDYFMKGYKEKLNAYKFQYDEDGDGVLDTGELVKNNVINYYR